MQESAARFEQPSGKAFPALLPAKSPTTHDHLRAVLPTNPRDFLIHKAITPQIRNITSRIKDPPELVARERLDILKHIESLSTRLDPARIQWQSALPKDSPSANINFRVLHLILTSLNYKGKSATSDISRGLPIAGPATMTHVLKQKQSAIFTHSRLSSKHGNSEQTNCTRLNRAKGL